MCTDLTLKYIHSYNFIIYNDTLFEISLETLWGEACSVEHMVVSLANFFQLILGVFDIFMGGRLVQRCLEF